MNPRLVLPSPSYESSYCEYINELGDEERYPFPMDFEHRDFQELLKKLSNFAMGVDLPAEFVPSSTYWLILEGELVGVSNLRHYLNERIREHDGHIGLGIRPKYRGKGYGKELLRLTIAKAAGMGIKEVHIHCHKSNEASARMITGNGALLDSEELESGSNEVVQRYIFTVT